MISSKYIIHKEGVEVLNELFHPFIKEKGDQNTFQIESEQVTKSLSADHQVMQKEIQKIKQEVDSLSSKKEELQNEIARLEEKKNKIQEEQEKIHSEAQTKAEGIISEAQKQVENMIAEAQQKKEDLEAEANNNKQQIIVEARKMGYREGFINGYKKGEQERKEIENYLKKILDEAIRKKNEVVESIRQHLVDLVYVAVQKVVKKITAEDKKVVLKNIVATLQKIDDPVKLIIKVSYDDLKSSTMFKSKLLASVKSLQQVEVVADPGIEPGGCIVETEFTIVDSRISTQLDKIGIALNSLDVIKSSTK